VSGINNDSNAKTNKTINMVKVIVEEVSEKK